MWGHVANYYLFAYLVMVALLLRGAPGTIACIVGALVGTVIAFASIILG